MPKQPEFFITSIVVKDGRLTIGYLGKSGPVTRGNLEPTGFFIGAWEKLRDAIVAASGFDLGFWELKDFRMSSLTPNLSKYGKELLANDAEAEAELASIQVKVSTGIKKDSPSVSSNVEVAWELAKDNKALIKALDDVVAEAINSLKKPVQEEATQLKLRVLGSGSTPTTRHLSVVQAEDAINVASQSADVDINAYTYNDSDLLDKNQRPLSEALLPQRKRRLIREGLATPISTTA